MCAITLFSNFKCCSSFVVQLHLFCSECSTIAVVLKLYCQSCRSNKSRLLYELCGVQDGCYSACTWTTNNAVPMNVTCIFAFMMPSFEAETLRFSTEKRVLKYGPWDYYMLSIIPEISSGDPYQTTGVRCSTSSLDNFSNTEAHISLVPGGYCVMPLILFMNMDPKLKS